MLYTTKYFCSFLSKHVKLCNRMYSGRNAWHCFPHQRMNCLLTSCVNKAGKLTARRNAFREVRRFFCVSKNLCGKAEPQSTAVNRYVAITLPHRFYWKTYRTLAVPRSTGNKCIKIPTHRVWVYGFSGIDTC